MNEREIEEALRRRPSDERVYEEPLAAITAGSPGRKVRGRNLVPALTAAGLVALLVAGLAIAGPGLGQPHQAGRTAATHPASSSPSPTVARTFIVYKMKQGDSLTSVASKFGISVDQLLAANPQIKDWRGIQVGMAVNVPWPDWQPAASTGSGDLRIPLIYTSKLESDGMASGCRWTADIDQPQLSPVGVATADDVNKAIVDEVGRYLADFQLLVQGFANQDVCTLVGTYAVAYASPDLLSIGVSLETTVGNGYTTPHSLNFDLKSGKQLRLADLFTDGDKALNLISTESRAQLWQRYLAEGMDLSLPEYASYAATVEEGTQPLASKFEAWTITPNGLHITFDTAQVGPRALGTPAVVIRWSVLAKVINSAGPAGVFLPHS